MSLIDSVHLSSITEVFMSNGAALKGLEMELLAASQDAKMQAAPLGYHANVKAFRENV